MNCTHPVEAIDNFVCNHVKIGLYAPVPFVTKTWYPIGMINSEYQTGVQVTTIWKCPRCFKVITDKNYIPEERTISYE